MQKDIKPAKTRRRLYHSVERSTTTCLRSNKATDWGSRRGRTCLANQSVSDVQASPTAGQIRRQAKRSAVLESSPSCERHFRAVLTETLNLWLTRITRRKTGTGLGEPKAGASFLRQTSMNVGDLAPWSLLVWTLQKLRSFEFWFGTLSGSCPRSLPASFIVFCLGHREPYIQRFFSHSCHRLQECVRLRGQTRGTTLNRRQTLCHRLSHQPWMLATTERDFAAETEETRESKTKLTLPTC